MFGCGIDDKDNRRNLTTMITTDFQLPMCEIVSEKTLNEEEERYYAAFNLVMSGYKLQSTRLRKVLTAYAKLETITKHLLDIHQKNPQSKPNSTPTKKSSTPQKLPSFHEDQNVCATDFLEDIEMVDLTSEFESEAFVKSTKNLEQEHHISPIFGDPKNQLPKKPKRSFSPVSKLEIPQNEDVSLKNDFLKSTKNQIESPLLHCNESSLQGNEENVAPLTNNTSRNTLINYDESAPMAKLGFSKVLYKMDRPSSTGKSLKQLTLVLQPVPPKIQQSSFDKEDPKASTSNAGENIFDPNYRISKNTMENPGDKNSSNIPKEPEKTEIKEDSLTFMTASQFDETDKSLFIDDVEFNDSQDLLNICMTSPHCLEPPRAIMPVSTATIVDSPPQPVTPFLSKTKGEKIFKRIAENWEVSESINETFFSPVEKLNSVKTAKVEEKPAKTSPACSFIARGNCREKSNSNSSKSFKRKSREMAVDADMELRDLGIAEFDWDSDNSNDNWTNPKKGNEKAFVDSFDMIPEKKKKNPQYACKKVERNKAKREKMEGWDCRECEEYYGAMNLPSQELKKRMNKCSRHKAKFNPRYCTPKDFWNPVFTDNSSDFSQD